MKAPTDLQHLDLQQFEQALDVHGADLSRWPAAMAEAADRLVGESPEAAVLLAQAERIDVLLGRVGAPEPSAALMRRVAEIPLKQPRAAGLRSWWPFDSFSRPALGLAAAALLGVATGGLIAEEQLGLTGWQETEQGTAQESATPWTAQEVDELSELAFALHLDDGAFGEAEW